MSKPLAGKRILVTRPLHQAATMLALLEEAGAVVCHGPVLDIVLNVSPFSKQTVIESDIAIFVSANGVRYGLQWLGELSFQKILAIGPGTARALAAAGYHSIHYPSGPHYNSEALLALPQLQQCMGQRIAIFSGRGGRKLLQETLEQRGASILKVECYQRRCPSSLPQDVLSLWQNQGFSAVICTSREGLRNLWDLLGAEARTLLAQTQLVVISKPMLNFAKQLGYPGVPLLAENATDQGIMTALTHWTMES